MAEWIINQKTSPDFGDTLEHHGVLGMKWGVRKAEKEAHYRQNLGTDNLLEMYKKWGKGGVRRMSRSVDRGRTAAEAQTKEERRRKRIKSVKRLIGAGITIGAAAAYLGSPMGQPAALGLEHLLTKGGIRAVYSVKIGKAGMTSNGMRKKIEQGFLKAAMTAELEGEDLRYKAAKALLP